jgi:hypothetical protein
VDCEWLKDLEFVIANATTQELMRHEGDTIIKQHRRGQMTGTQGIILDAMDAGHITPMDAHRLLVQVNKRLNGSSAGLCRVTEGGDLVAIGSAQQEVQAHGR